MTPRTWAEVSRKSLARQQEFQRVTFSCKGFFDNSVLAALQRGRRNTNKGGR